MGDEEEEEEEEERGVEQENVEATAMASERQVILYCFDLLLLKERERE